MPDRKSEPGGDTSNATNLRKKETDAENKSDANATTVISPQDTTELNKSANQQNGIHSYFNPCFCCSCSLRSWCLFISSWEIVFYLTEVIILANFLSGMSADYNQNVRSLYKGLRTAYPHLNRVKRSSLCKPILYFASVTLIRISTATFLGVNVISLFASIIFFLSTLLMRKRLLLVYPLWMLIAEIVNSGIVLFFGMGEYFGLYGILRGYFLICSVGLFTQYRAGLYVKRGVLCAAYQDPNFA